MAFDAGAIVARLRLDAKKFNAELQSTQTKVSKWDKVVGRTLAAGVAATGITILARQISQAVEGLVKFTDQAARLRDMTDAFDRMASSAGTSSEEVVANVRQITKSLSNQQIQQAGNTLELLGVGIGNLPRFTQIARAAAVGLGKDVGFMLESLSTGTARQSRLWLDNLGIIISVEKANKKYAQQLGITTKEMTDQQQRAAFLNEVLVRGQDVIDKVGAGNDLASEKTQRLFSAWQNLTDLWALQVADSKLPDFLSGIATQIEKITEDIEDNKKKRAEAEKFGVKSPVGGFGTGLLPPEAKFALKFPSLIRDGIEALDELERKWNAFIGAPLPPESALRLQPLRATETGELPIPGVGLPDETAISRKEQTGTKSALFEKQRQAQEEEQRRLDDIAEKEKERLAIISKQVDARLKLGRIDAQFPPIDPKLLEGATVTLHPDVVEVNKELERLRGELVEIPVNLTPNIQPIELGQAPFQGFDFSLADIEVPALTGPGTKISIGDDIADQVQVGQMALDSLGSSVSSFFEFIVVESDDAGRAFAANMLNGISGVASAMGDLLIKSGIGIEALKTLSGFAAIAAGLALKAIAGLMRGASFKNAPIPQQQPRTLRNVRQDEMADKGDFTLVIQGDFMGDKVWIDRLMEKIRGAQRNRGVTIIHEAA